MTTLRTVTRRLIGTAAALAAAVALMTAAAAVPARADDGRDLARALAGLAILGIIVNELDKDDNRARPQPHHPPHRWTPPAPPRPAPPPRWGRDDRRDGRGWDMTRRDDRRWNDGPHGRHDDRRHRR